MIEVLKQALEALETRICSSCSESEICCAPAIKDAIQAGRQAIREHAMYEVQRLGQEIEQEPVAWLEPEWGERICPEIGFEATITSDHPRDLCWIPLYPRPPQRTWVGLTDEDIDELHGSPMSLEHSGELKWVRIIEAKLKEKNNA